MFAVAFLLLLLGGLSNRGHIKIEPFARGLPCRTPVKWGLLRGQRASAPAPKGIQVECISNAKGRLLELAESFP